MYLIFEEDQVFLSSVVQYIYKTLAIIIKTLGPYNHSSLKTERHIRTINGIIVKQSTGTGQMWTHYLQTCAYACNSFASLALNGVSLFQVIYGRPQKDLLK